jgi:hypothetical protein
MIEPYLNNCLHFSTVATPTDSNQIHGIRWPMVYEKITRHDASPAEGSSSLINVRDASQPKIALVHDQKVRKQNDLPILA